MVQRQRLNKEHYFKRNLRFFVMRDTLLASTFYNALFAWITIFSGTLFLMANGILIGKKGSIYDTTSPAPLE